MGKATKGYHDAMSKRMPPSTKAKTPANTPMKLMIPFALERSVSGNMSPSKATVGVRKNAMERVKRNIAAKRSINDRSAAKGMANIPRAASGAAAMMKGKRRPKRFHVRSERVPAHGWMNMLT